MKSVLVIVAFLFSASALAANVCVDVPEGVKADSITTNFDGSVSFVNPTVYADAEYLRIVAPATNNYPAVGFCTVLNRKYLGSNYTTLESAESLANITEDGSYLGSVNGDTRYFAYTRIVCK